MASILTKIKEELQKWSRKQLIVMVAMALSSIFGAMYGSLLAPFFANEAVLKKKATYFEAGLVFGIFPCVNLVMSPIYGHFMKDIGCHFMFVTSIFIAGSCAILFGILEYCPVGRIYIVMCLLVRGVEAMACAGSSTASYTMTAHVFPGKVSTVSGVLQASGCLGLMLGPPIGGVLIDAGGFKTPFLVTGGAYILCGIFIFCILPRIDDSTDEEAAQPAGKWWLLVHPLILVVGFMVLVAQAAIGFIDISLADHLKATLKLKSTVIGLVFLVPAILVVALAPIYGVIADRCNASKLFMITGPTIGAFAFLLLGPAPFLPDIFPRKSLWLIIVSLVVSAVGWGSLVVAFPEYVKVAKSKGYPESLTTHGFISGIFNSFNSIGAFIGPVIGGYLIQNIHFEKSCTVVAGALALSGILVIIYSIIVCIQRKIRGGSSQSGTDTDKLLDEETVVVNEPEGNIQDANEVHVQI